MSPADALPWWAALPTALLLVFGGVITLVGALGLVRLKHFYQRIHGPAITITLDYDHPGRRLHPDCVDALLHRATVTAGDP